MNIFAPGASFKNIFSRKLSEEDNISPRIVMIESVSIILFLMYFKEKKASVIGARPIKKVVSQLRLTIQWPVLKGLF